MIDWWNAVHNSTFHWLGSHNIEQMFMSLGNNCTSQPNSNFLILHTWMTHWRSATIHMNRSRRSSHHGEGHSTTKWWWQRWVLHWHTPIWTKRTCPTFSLVTLYGRLQIIWITETVKFALEWVQILGIPENRKSKLGISVVVIWTKQIETYWVLRVKAADVMLEGRPSPLMTSCHCFLLMTSTRPPRATTRLYSSYRSSTCFAIMGNRLIGVPRFCMNANNSSRNSFLFGLSSIS